METERYYQISGLKLCFSGWQLPQKDGDRLPMFAASPQKPEIEIHLAAVQSIFFPEQAELEWEEPYLRSCRMGDEIHRYYRREWKPNGFDYAHLSYSASTPHIRRLELCNRGFALDEKQVLACIGSEELFLRFDRAILHSSCVDCGGQAILFSGPSGIGKSTQAALWKTYCDAEIKNGDRNLLRFQNDSVLSCGTPYAGTSGICTNYELPVAAIVFLEQAKANEISRLTPAQATRLLLTQLPVPRWDATAIGKVADVAAKVATLVPIYRLCCLPNQSAVLLLQKTLAKER